MSRNFSKLQHRYLDAKFDAIRAAMAKAESLAVHNQEISNEFRGQLKDQAETLMSRAEAVSRFESVDQKIDTLRADIATLRESQSTTGGLEAGKQRLAESYRLLLMAVVAVVGAVVAVAMFLRK